MIQRALIIVSLLFGAQAASAASVNIAANDPGLRYAGRVDFGIPTAPRFGWPGIAVEAAFSGTSVGILLNEQVGGYSSYFDATIDGGSPRRITSNAGTQTQYNVSGLAAGNHSLRLVRRSESYGGWGTNQEYSVFGGLVLDAGASLQALPAAPVRKFEVIGDSLSVGYGNESPSQTCSGTVSQFTNNDLAYGSLVARAFCAEVHSTAVSGHGMCHNYDDTVAMSVDAMPALYDRTIAGAASPSYNFAAWPADAVIIFLGTNDYSNVNPPSQLQYETAYKALIADIRVKYAASNPWIFCVYAGWPTQYGPYVQNVVSYENTTMADAKVIAINIGSVGTSACDWHPSVAEDAVMATTVKNAITAATGWVQGSCPSVSSPTPTATPTRTPTTCGACTATFTPSASPTPGAAKLYCVHIDYSAVPALANERKLTLKVSAGTASSVSVLVDGSAVASSYNVGTGMVTFSTTGADAVISANGWTSGGTGAATKAQLYDDHHWAHSLTLDDGIQSQYDNARPVLAARGLRAGIALNASGIQTANPWNMTWAEAQALRAAGWDIFNHSYSHPSITCANFATEFQQNQTLFQTKFPGYNVSHVVYPFEDTSAALCAGWPPSYILSGEGGGGLNYVDAAFPNVYRLYRNGLYGASSSAWQAAAASAAGNARPSWLITITHSVAAASAAPSDAYSTNADTLAAYLDYIWNTFGPSGSNSVWFAPSGEVYDYILTRDNAVVTTLSCGTPTPTPTVCGACTSTPTVTATLTRTQTMTATPTPPCSPLVLDNMDDNNTQNGLGGYWFNYPGTGTSSVNPAVFAMTAPGNGGSGYCARAYGNADVAGPPSVGTGLPSSDLSAYSGLTFWIKGEGKAVRFQLHSAVEAGNYNDYKYDFTPPAGWSLITIPWSSLVFPGWGPAYSLDTVQVTGLSWVPMNSGAYDFSVDDLNLTCAGPPSPTPSSSPTRTASPSATPTRTPSASPSATRTATASATPSASATATPSVSPIYSATDSPTLSPVYSPTATPSATATPSQSPSFTATPSSTQSPVLSPTPSSTPTSSFSASPSSSVTGSPTATPSVTLTASPSATLTASATASPSATQSSTASPSSTVTATFTPTDVVTSTHTPSATPTSTQTTVGASSPTPGPDGPLVILGTAAFPQPNPQSVRLHLDGAAERSELRLFSAAMTCVGRIDGPGSLGAGWVSVPLSTVALPSGLYFYEAEARRGSVRSKPVTGRLLVLR